MRPAERFRSIASRARTIYERVDDFHRRDRAILQSTGGPDVVDAWTRIYSPGDTAALTSRLGWDRLTPDIVRAASTAPASGSIPEWIAWFERAHDAPVGRFRWMVRPDDPPFTEVWMPILRAARAALEARIPSAALGTAAWTALERQLLRELSICGELAIDQSYSADLASSGVDRRSLSAITSERYHAFVGGILADDLNALWETYPVLARQVAEVVDRWVATQAELVDRLTADRARIAVDLNHGVDPGGVLEIQPGLSDPHDGRRRVAVIRFANGLRVVYKPRDVTIESAFESLAAWLASRGLEHAIPVCHVVASDGYGWVAFAEPEEFENSGDVARYYRQAGALIFFTHLLGSRDLHMENVVATRGGPVIVDLELLLQPDRESSESHDDRSCLRSGLLSLIQIGGSDEVYDVGGLRGSGRMPLAMSRRRWTGQGTDAISFVEESTTQSDVKNAVILQGKLQTPESFRQDVLRGFDDAYRFTMERREALLASGGPLEPFRTAQVRVLARSTNQYALLNELRNAPRHLRDGAVRSMLTDVLLRPLRGASVRPREWPLLVEERRAIESLDVPRFVVAADDRSVYSEGRRILENYYARAPLDAVRDRLDALSDEDREAQWHIIDRALRDTANGRFSTAFAAGDDAFVEAAEWIGREIVARTDFPNGATSWSGADLDTAAAHHLYDGAIGPAVFFAALASTSGAPRWQEAARAALAPTTRWADSADTARLDRDVAIGGCSGLGSIVYGLALAGTLLGDEQAILSARRVSQLIDPRRIEADLTFDVVGGSAGAILGVLALHTVTGDASLVDIARACGDRLLARHIERTTGWTWPSPHDGRRLVGFAHGAAGIATALNRLAAATGDREYRNAAMHAAAFVGACFSARDAAWPTAELDASDISTTVIRMNAWCHGAPGVALAAGAGGNVESLSANVRLALERMADWSPAQGDHLCCGHLGRADVLLTAGVSLNVADAAGRARAIAARVLVRARRHQHFRLSGPGFDYRVFDPGFFRGLSGIGYELLRVVDPGRLPSVLAFEAPAQPLA